MIRRFVLVAAIVLSTLTTGAGEPGRPNSSPRDDEGRLFNDRGVMLLGIGRLDEAIDLFTQAITGNLHLATTYYNRGNAYLLRKEPERAIADYSDTIKSIRTLRSRS